MGGFILFAILVIARAHSSIAALVIQGPDKPVLENDEVTLECLLSDSELNTSQVHFEKFSKYMNNWYRLEEEPMYHRCIPGVILRRETGQLLLSIRSIHSYFHQGLYRCVADNATATDNSSQPLAITVNYMRELSVYDVSSSRKFIKENLHVTLGEDVEVECSTTGSEAPQYSWQKYGEDWIVPSPKLRLKNVRLEDGGDYTCMAEHPTLSSLKKSSTISITVLPATNGRLHQAWYDSTNLVLMTSVAVAVVLVLLLSITVFLVRRAKQAKSTKGPIDDRSQKKPIYTASVESLPSTSGDKQPLV
ncbi:leucine-rich repeats and immunoglobulin-like domains protein 1 [Coregonus clupeaformis]|uniref:leucine-rich repeats and immunoglobulin-like domains protein 1 n=1 Tax=Coregonus clupeaformis TaxID=59861 RepID=UPI001E1C750C|nr:leucine-rich repeats and immunoglobulin-like domains protein 1 [Coregonus clupeaformis]